MQTKDNGLFVVNRYYIVCNLQWSTVVGTQMFHYEHSDAEPTHYSLPTDMTSYGRLSTLTQDLASLVERM